MSTSLLHSSHNLESKIAKVGQTGDLDIDLGSNIDLCPNCDFQPNTDLELDIDYWWTVPGGDSVAGNQLVLQELEETGPYTCHVTVSYHGNKYNFESSTYIDTGNKFSSTLTH